MKMIHTLIRKPKRQGLSLIEVVVSTLLVGIMLIGAMNCLGAVIRGRMEISHEARAPQLAQQLMAEILNTEYQDTGPLPLFGLEVGELGINRLDFDDVDDFNGWSKSPPQHRDGTPVANSSGWSREVTVQWVDPNNPSSPSGSDQGLKRITVTVRRNGIVVAQIFALRSSKYSP